MKEARSSAAMVLTLQSWNIGIFINSHNNQTVEWQIKLECAASYGNRYPPYPQVMATAISQ